MAKVKSDIEIARKAKMMPINKILAKINVPDKSSAFSPMGRHIAKIRADGTLISHDTKGSIHQVGAKLEGLPSCNGWAYWHFKIDGSSAPIDVLRQKLISEISNINH